MRSVAPRAYAIADNVNKAQNRVHQRSVATFSRKVPDR